jgi:hypothetical protein
LDDQGRPLPVTVATGGFVWCRNLTNFREGGLAYDYGWGAAPVALDAPNTDGRQGFIAFTRGRPAYLPCALCETEPAVQEFWLQCLEEMIAAGVDGVDFREENHSTHTDHPEDYGFNEVILRQCEGLQGQALLSKVAEVRGNAWTDFLTKCRRRLQAAGAKMRYHLQVDWLRPDRPRARALAYPANVDWQWRRWVDKGLMDEAVIRFYHLQPDFLLADPVTQEIIETCRARGLRVVWNRYLAQAANNLPAELEAIRKDGRFSGFILYETYDFVRFHEGGKITCAMPIIEQALRQGLEP